MINPTPLNPDAVSSIADVILRHCGGYVDTTRVDAERAAKAVLRSLAVAQPEVNSVEELAALPINSLVLDRFDYPHHKCAQSKPDFTNLRTGHFISRGEFYFPARVLYRPEVKP